MRGKIYVGFLIIFMTMFLAGCITIPLGDGNVIKISETGIEFVKADDEDDEINRDNKGSVTTGGGAGTIRQKESTTPKADEPEENEATPPNLAEDDEEEDEEEEEKLSGFNLLEEPLEYVGEPEEDTECNYDYTEFTDHIGTEIYIPYCAIMVDVEELSYAISASFLVDLVFYDDILHNYKLFLGSGRDPDTDLDLKNPEYIHIYGTIKDGKDLHVRLAQREGYVFLTLDYR